MWIGDIYEVWLLQSIPVHIFIFPRLELESDFYLNNLLRELSLSWSNKADKHTCTCKKMSALLVEVNLLVRHSTTDCFLMDFLDGKCSLKI